MREIRGRVAVVTGAASGIGRALAERFSNEGMRVVMADVEEAPLRAACDALRAQGAEAIAVVTDVSRAADVEHLAVRAQETFGGVHVVCNNAGVIAGGVSWEAPIEDYQWLFDVNVWGVIHGVRTFVPILLAQGEEAHIVNTSSMAGVTTLPYASIYHMTKHAVLAYSESLYHELRLSGSAVGVSVLCPEGVATRIDESERNRPAALRGDAPASPAREVVAKALSEQTRAGIDPAEIAGRVVRAILEDRFYVLSDDTWRRACDVRLEDVRTGRNPTLTPPG
jgi:NAD(P)-dependent dehydrogenase (short-subunit alcohol dehydrogenase family)